MTAPDTVRIGRDELFDPEIDHALARERARHVRVVAEPPPVSRLRRLLNNSLFHLPVAAVIAALVCWSLLEPHITDMPVVGGEVLLIDGDPFDAPGMVVFTVGDHAVYVDPDRVALEPGSGGQPALARVADIQVGDRIEAAGLTSGGRLVAAAVRPGGAAGSHGSLASPTWALILLFPLTATLIAFGLLVVEGITTRNWLRMLERALLGSFLAGLFALLGLLPAGLFVLAQQRLLAAELPRHADLLVVTVRDVGGLSFLLMTACRSAAWACVGAATGVGMNLVRATRAQLRNATIGGALGGAVGGLFFDPIARWLVTSPFDDAGTSRLVGLIAVGLSIGVFVALVERLAREAWLRVRTGPLAGKSFIIYKTPTVLGSAPASDVYLFKDAGIDPAHASIHRVGTAYEVEDLGSRTGTQVNGTEIRRRRLASGDQVVVGDTILDFEERHTRPATAGAPA